MNLDRTIPKTLLVVAILAFVPIHSLPPACAQFQPVTVFENGEAGYKIFRIPAIVLASNGDLLAFCEARQGGDLSEIDLVLKRSSDKGKTWQKLKVVQESDDFRDLFDKGKKEISVGNPAPVVDRLDPQYPGRIWLPFTLENDRVFVTYSDDHGKTWSKRRELTKAVKKPEWGWYATGPVHSIQIQKGKHKGRLVIPCDHRLGDDGEDRGENGAHAFISDDHGKSWKMGAIDDTYKDGLNANETTVVELNDGRLYFNTRDQNGNGPGTRGDAFSSDGGLTFDRSNDEKYKYFVPSPKIMDPPAVQCSLLRAGSKNDGDPMDLILFSGPDENGPTGKGRTDLRIRYSTDEANTWLDGPLIHEGKAAYSDMVRFEFGSYGVLFEVGGKKNKYERIVFAAISQNQLGIKNENGADANAQPGSKKLSSSKASLSRRPNVLFLCVDDMKDWVNCLGGYEGTVHTPNIDRLAKMGTLFTNAHCPSPKCAPSRAAIMTGLRPSTTGLYDNGHWWLPNLPGVVTIPANFRNHGYHVVGAGKIFHHTAGNHPPNQWDDFQRLEFHEDPWFRGVKLNYPWTKHKPYPIGFPFSGVEGLGHENDWGSLAIPDADYDDALTTEYAIRLLNTYARTASQSVDGTNQRIGKQVVNRSVEMEPTANDKPFFLACGLFRPHLPWYVPKKYFDKYPLEDIVLPEIRDDDLNDLPSEGLKFAKARRSDFETIKDANKWKHAIQAYLASITCADARLGRVLDALAKSPHARNTVIVLWSDHGWHLGEKQHWHKTTLWEEATRVPFIISSPDQNPGICDRPVSILNLYPTLNDLCQLPNSPYEDGRGLSIKARDEDISKLDGVSLVPLLENPDADWNRPALIEFKRGNVAVRTERFRYIRYHDGGEELYDHDADPNEWTNLASSPEHAATKKELSKWLTKSWAKSAQTKSAFQFDHEEFTWTNKKTTKVTYGKTK